MAPLLKLKGHKPGVMKKKDNQPTTWTPQAENTFMTLKEKLINSDTLKFPDFFKNFVLTTDASDISVAGTSSAPRIMCCDPLPFLVKN